MEKQAEVKNEVKVEKKKVNHRYNRDKEREKVKGIFRFFEVPGGTMSFIFKKYKEDPVERYDMVDGQIYEIPLGVARHLCKNLWYPEYDYIKGEDAKNVMKVTKKVRRCTFQSLEFIDTEDFTDDNKSILEVTSAL